ncbi:MAG: plasmid pRiA4b ORF-3 family protein, partial [Planctomycetes bacterium]|nr:plasmid pRiA4b ORF-3 family protein [Planctomycetota bacterium]
IAMAQSKQRHRRLEAKRKRRQKRVAKRQELGETVLFFDAAGPRPGLADLLFGGLPRRKSAKRQAKPKPKPAVLFQFRVTLEGTNPPVWRQIQVPDCTLLDLHHYIQTAMGWENDHLHEFVFDGRCYGNPQMLDFREVRDEETTLLSDLLPPAGRKKPPFTYMYDFGDSWQHRLEFEQLIETEDQRPAAKCLAGARACPPEDIGGVWGYADLVEMIQNPDEYRDDERLECFEDYDPDAFDPEAVTALWQKWK